MRATRKGDSTSESSVGVSVSSLHVADVESIVEKAVTAATKVIPEEFEKLFTDMSERIQQLEGRLEAVESAAESVFQDQRPNVSADIAELTGKMEAMGRRQGPSKPTAFLGHCSPGRGIKLASSAGRPPHRCNRI